MSTQVSKRQQQRNEQILQGLLKYRPCLLVCIMSLLICLGSQGTVNVLTAVLQIRAGQVIISVRSFSVPDANNVKGIFLCVRCAIVHRKIGTHITKVKSLTLDKWTPEQIAVPLLLLA